MHTWAIETMENRATFKSSQFGVALFSSCRSYYAPIVAGRFIVKYSSFTHVFNFRSFDNQILRTDLHDVL